MATHGDSSSTVLVRVWREGDVVNRGRCEERARSWRALPEREGAEIVERRALGLPEDFDTVVEVGLIPPPPRAPAGTPLQGFVMAFGGWAHRCFAYVFTTSASGVGAEQAVGERLALMMEGSLPKIVFESALEPKIPSRMGP